MSEVRDEILWAHGSLKMEVTGNDEVADLIVLKTNGPASSVVLGQKFSIKNMDLKGRPAYEYARGQGEMLAVLFDTIRKESQ